MLVLFIASVKMNREFRDTESDASDAVEKLKQKYVERRKQV